jgi:hypothetical protein
MRHVNPNRAGLSVAAVLAGWHAVWALLVASGVAQQAMESAYALHAMKADAVVVPFNSVMAGLLILATAVIGYVSGFMAAFTWNCLERWSAHEEMSARPADASRQSATRHAA